ncbi:MAG: TIR domain-containing protein [Cellulomonas sp.]
MNQDMVKVLRHLAQHFADPGAHRLDTPFEVPTLDFDKDVAPSLKRLAEADPPFVTGITAWQADYPIVITGLTERGMEAAEEAGSELDAAPGSAADVPLTAAVSPSGTKYQVALSFAGEQRTYVQRVASALKVLGVEYFYDAEEQVELWGKNQIEELQRIYSDDSFVAVMFISGEYATKVWPTHERRSILSRAIQERRVYVLPVRFDDVVLPGLDPDASYLKAGEVTPEDVAEMIARKLVLLGGAVPARSGDAVGWARAATGRGSADMTVTVADDAGRLTEGAHILAVASNGTYVAARTDAAGVAVLTLPTRRLVTIYAAHAELTPAIVSDHDPANDLELTLPRAEGAGSVIFEQGAGQLPVLSGRLNPIRDADDRHYLYADNIAINDDPHQPYYFTPGHPLGLEDASGARATVTVVSTIGRSSLIRFDC